jgi:hypothetical protein
MKGSTGIAIVLIGLGVLGIGLAYTDRTRQVWDALMGAAGGSGSGGAGEWPNGTKQPSGGCPSGSRWDPICFECINNAFPLCTKPQPGGDGGQYFVNAAGGVRSSSGASITY